MPPTKIRGNSIRESALRQAGRRPKPIFAPLCNERFALFTIQVVVGALTSFRMQESARGLRNTLPLVVGGGPPALHIGTTHFRAVVQPGLR
jgi:hypothetical protein